jgi:hypothetical protein
MLGFDDAKFRCPTCRGAVARIHRSFDTGDFVATMVADWPFWIVFLVCSAIGMVSFIAGAIAFVGAAAVAVAYVRARAQFRCTPCRRTFGISELVSEGAASNNGA